MIRIIAGTYRSRILEAPVDDAVTRPYTAMVREAVFNRLRGWFDGARVLDLFSGVGSMGLEAASRGASEVMLVEKDRSIAAFAQRNIEALDCGDRVRVVCADALGPTIVDRAPRPLDVVFVDPPYTMMQSEDTRARVGDAMRRVADICADESLFVLRTPVDPDRTDHAIEGLHGPEPHRYGASMWVLLYEPARSTSDASGNAESAI